MDAMTQTESIRKDKVRDEENELFERYIEAEGAQRAAYEVSLITALNRHAAKLVWQTLQKQRPEIVNWAVQEALHHADSFRGESKFTTWFHKIVVHRCLDEVRKEKTRKEVSIEDPSVMEMASDPVENELYEQIIRELTGKEREFLELKVVYGYSDEEVASKLKTTLGGVKSKWHRLKAKLAKRFDTGA